MKSIKKTATEVFAKKETAKPDYSKKIERALVLDNEIEIRKKELEDIKVFFHNEFELDKSVENIATDKGTALLKKTNSYSVIEVELTKLKDIFKKSFKAYVTEKVSYGVSAAFKTLLKDDGYEFKDSIRKAVAIKESKSVVFVPIK